MVMAPVLAGSALLSWTPPTTREDGTALLPSEILKYNVYIDDTYSAEIPGTASEWLLVDVLPGYHKFELTAVDLDNLESIKSVPAYKDVINITSPPNAPTVDLQRII